MDRHDHESDAPRYKYFRSGMPDSANKVQRKTEATLLSRERRSPSPENPDQVLLQQRKHNLLRWIDRLPPGKLDVLDVGGRIQPYRDLIQGRLNRYIGLDPQLEGLVDIVAVGEALPFFDSYFDFVICTQVLSYAKNPFKMAAEMYRVLKPRGALFLTTPAFFPEHSDELWRFLPRGIEALLAGWRYVQIAPEGNSTVGVLRTIGVWINTRAPSGRVASALGRRSIRALNRLERKAVGRAGTTWMTANYSVWAEK